MQPEALVLLGATAAKALLGSSFRVTQHRGELLDSDLAPHRHRHDPPVGDPARRRDERARARRARGVRRDLRVVAEALSR